MKSFRSILLVYSLLLLLTAVSSGRMIALAGPPAEKKDICINWAFGALIGPENNRKLIRITKDTTLKTGNQFKMMVELKSRCFVYLIYSGSNGETQMLFPGDISQLNKSYTLAEKYYIPQGDLWFALDEQTGLERFYLLVSKNRLSELEDLLKKYESLGSDKKPDMARQIVNLIKKTNKKSNDEYLEEMYQLVQEGTRALYDGKLENFGKILHKNWELKKKLSSKITNSQINEIYSTALNNGALGGKLLGAGSGGFLLIFAKPENHNHIRSALKSYHEVDFEFEESGSEIIFYQ